MMITTSTPTSPPELIAGPDRVSNWLEQDGAGDSIMSPEGWVLDCNRAASRMLG